MNGVVVPGVVTLEPRCTSEVMPMAPYEDDFALVPERFIEVGRPSGARVFQMSDPNNPTANLLCVKAAQADLADQGYLLKTVARILSDGRSLTRYWTSGDSRGPVLVR